MSIPDDRLARAVENAARHESEIKKGARKQQMRAATKKAGPRDKARPVRANHWTLAQSGDWDEVDVGMVERIMPRGERDRRRTIARSAFVRPVAGGGVRDEAEQRPGCEKGLVVEVGSSGCQVELGQQTVPCQVRGSLTSSLQEFTNVVAVGDDVWVMGDGAGGWIVEAVLPRRSALARPEVMYGHLRQVIVANADQLLIVAAWKDPPIWLELVDRYLIAAGRSGLQPIVCINKIDLAASRSEIDEVAEVYRSLDAPVILASAVTGQGIEDLRRLLRGRLTALAGLSGVGKSSMLTAVQPGFQLRTGAVSETGGQGRHTTTQVTLMHLEMGGTVVDTPGIREFGLSGILRDELQDYFPELAGVRCRFGDCTHRREPGCGIRKAVQERRIAASRFHSFERIAASLPVR